MRTFETDDALSRKQFSDFLLHLIEHRSKYKRDNQFQNYSLMPPVSRFGGGRAQKKQGVIDKLKAFFEKFFGIGRAKF